MTMTQNKQAKQYPWWKWIFVVLGLLIAIVGVPIGINECYKANTGYITVWNGADMLAFYGTILGATIGAAIAVLTIVATISFNRKQIQRDAYLNSEREKWGAIEATISKALDMINPKHIMLVGIDFLADSNNDYPISVILAIQRYQIDCRLAPDQLYTCLSSVDYPKVKIFLDAMAKASQQFFDIAQKECNLYEAIRKLKSRDIASRIIKNESMLPNLFTPEDLNFASSILSKTKDLNSDAVYAQIKTENEKLANAYETTYRQLLSLKGQTFDTIYTEIQKNADEILRFRRKNNA